MIPNWQSNSCLQYNMCFCTSLSAERIKSEMVTLQEVADKLREIFCVIDNGCAAFKARYFHTDWHNPFTDSLNWEKKITGFNSFINRLQFFINYLVGKSALSMYIKWNAVYCVFLPYITLRRHRLKKRMLHTPDNAGGSSPYNPLVLLVVLLLIAQWWRKDKLYHVYLIC